jgi:hypothetical protein
VPSWNPETTEKRADASPPVVARVRELLAQLFSQRLPAPADQRQQSPADAGDERERGDG